MSNVEASKSTVWPAPFKAMAPPVDVTVTPPAPSRVNAPALVVKFEAAPASREIAELASKVAVLPSISRLASRSRFPEASTAKPVMVIVPIVKSPVPSMVVAPEIAPAVIEAVPSVNVVPVMVVPLIAAVAFAPMVAPSIDPLSMFTFVIAWLFASMAPAN